MTTFQHKPGLGLTAAYQVSGKPFVTGALDARFPGGGLRVGFPNVTSWVVVVNNDAVNACRVGFSQDGVVNENYFTVQAMADTAPNAVGPLDLKVTEVWLSGSTDVDIMAGLTYIETGQINNSSVSPSGSNWSGSLGALVG